MSLEIDNTIVKKYRKRIWKLFMEAVFNYELIQDNDKILVCISGGKDSFLMAKCLDHLQRFGKLNFNLVFLVMDPGYKKEVLQKIKDLAKIFHLDIIIEESDIFEVSNKLNREKPCYLCSRMRRGFLYQCAEKYGCNKISLGHHLDDVVETTLMSIFLNGEFKTMMPKLKSTNFNGLELIRPLYLIREKDIINWKNNHQLEFATCACPFEEKTEGGKRQEIKELIQNLEKDNPAIVQNILNSLSKVNLDTIISYVKNDKTISFLDDY